MDYAANIHKSELETKNELTAGRSYGLSKH